jgi:hypothetical protein
MVTTSNATAKDLCKVILTGRVKAEEVTEFSVVSTELLA